MSSNPVILSLIVPMFNMQDYIGRCLDSVCGLPDGSGLEVIVINDGSTDSSLETARNYESAHPGTVRVLDKANGNYGSCINAGLKLVSGRFVKVLDADDALVPEELERFLTFLGSTDADAVISDFETVTPDGRTTGRTIYRLPDKASLGDITSLKDLWIHAVAYSTSIFRSMDYRQTEGISYTDQEWLFLPMSRVRTACRFPGVLYRYTCGRKGQTTDPEVFVRSISQEITGLKVMLVEYAAGGPWEEEAGRYLESRLAARMSAVYSMFLLYCPDKTDRKELLALDSFIRDNHPGLYDMSDGIEAPLKCIRFRYVASWRRNGFRRGPGHILCTAYKKVRRFLLG